MNAGAASGSRSVPAPGRYGILNWPNAERPRERLRSLGSRTLATRELLAILVGSGGRDGSAMDVADLLLQRAGGSLRRLAALPATTLTEVPGVGAATAARVLASLELGRRAGSEESPARHRIQGPRDVLVRMGPHLRDLEHEEFHALLLNSQHRVIRDVLVTRGILDASLIHPREVFKPAIVESAAAVILVHNHPSGDPTPSAEDRAVTRQLAAAGRSVGIHVLDHVILGDGRFVSLMEEGVLDAR
jgi:DNA repair protein RadC